MPISLADNLKIQKKSQNVERDSFSTFAQMKAYSENYLPDVFLCVNYEDGGIYLFNRANSIDAITGKWRKVNGEGNIYTDEDKAKVDKIGEWSELNMPTATTIVKALNILNNGSVAKIEWINTKLIFKNSAGTIIETIDLSELDQEFNIGDLLDVDITNVVNKQQLRYSATLGKWINFTDDTYDRSTAYTDQEIAKSIVDRAQVVDAKPTPQTATPSVWYYWKDTDNVWWQTTYLKNASGILTEITISVGTIDLTKYVNKELDVDRTFAESPTDLNKVPDLHWIEGLRNAINEDLEKKVNIEDIVDDLDSDLSDVPLSAKQGKKLKEMITEAGGGIFDQTEGTLITVGGLKAGTVIKDWTDHQALTAMLFPYQAPVATITTSPNDNYAKKGTSVTVATITCVITKKSNPLTKATLKINGTDYISSTAYAQGGTWAIPYGATINADTTFTLVMEDGTASPTSVAKTIKFIYPMYYGVVGASLTEVLQEKSNITQRNITVTNGKVTFKYLSSYGNLTSILDPNGFEVLPTFTLTNETIDGQIYNVYTTTNAFSATNFSFTYKF